MIFMVLPNNNLFTQYSHSGTRRSIRWSVTHEEALLKGTEVCVVMLLFSNGKNGIKTRG